MRHDERFLFGRCRAVWGNTGGRRSSSRSCDLNRGVFQSIGKVVSHAELMHLQERARDMYPHFAQLLSVTQYMA
jgi:hypothetical protein